MFASERSNVLASIFAAGSVVQLTNDQMLAGIQPGTIRSMTAAAIAATANQGFANSTSFARAFIGVGDTCNVDQVIASLDPLVGQTFGSYSVAASGSGADRVYALTSLPS
jgi:hypothetical protein